MVVSVYEHGNGVAKVHLGNRVIDDQPFFVNWV